MPRLRNTEKAKAFAKHLGVALKAARKSAGLKNTVVSQDIGVSEKAISQWEVGKTLPSMSLLLAFCERCGVGTWTVVQAAENAHRMAQQAVRLDRQMRADREWQRQAYGEEA
jgi:DNA-binding XRE family transcriptional regulator